MLEQEPRAEERVNVHERGGLTPVHWKEVIKKIGKSKYETSAEIVAYGSKVLAGEYPDSGFHHRSFLGRRHWNKVASLDTRDKVRIPIPSRVLFFKKTSFKTSYVENQAMQAATEYAFFEGSCTYSIDDYLFDLSSSFGYIGLLESETLYANTWDKMTPYRSWLTWSPKEKKWARTEVTTSMERLSVFTSDYEDEWQPVSKSTTVAATEADSEILLHLWLLTKEDVNDVISSNTPLRSKLRSCI